MLHITQGQIGLRLELIFPIMLVVLSLKIKGYLQVRYVTGMRVLFFPSWKARAMKETV